MLPLSKPLTDYSDIHMINSSPPKAVIYASVNWVSIGSDNGLSVERRQAIIWTSADILSFRHQGTYFDEIVFEIQTFSFKKMRLNMSSAKWRPICPRGRWVKTLRICGGFYLGRYRLWYQKLSSKYNCEIKTFTHHVIILYSLIIYIEPNYIKLYAGIGWLINRLCATRESLLCNIQHKPRFS